MHRARALSTKMNTRNPGETEKDISIRRLDRERFWMLELGTMYPYGLNDR